VADPLVDADRSPDAVVFGEAMAMFVPVDDQPLETAETYHRYVAGAEFNVAVGLARLGFRVGWISRVGADPLGSYLRAEAQRHGVDTARVTVDPQRPTGFQLKSRAADPQVVYFRAGSAASALVPEPEDLSYVSGSRHLHVTGIPPALSSSARAFTLEAMRAARASGVPVTFDPNLRPVLWPSVEQMRAVLNSCAAQADWVLPGYAEGLTLTGRQTPEEIADFYLQRGCHGVAVKLGVDGSCAITRDGRTDVPAYPVTVVDTVGAGDGFAVGFISGLLDQCPLEECLHRANAVGALAVTQRGDNEGLPTRAQLDDFMRERRPDPDAAAEELAADQGRPA
jgi:2-dehydro-3-deoxygluconokinase